MIWEVALSSMLDYPVTFVTGFGWYAYQSDNFNFQAHRTYIDLLYNLGMIGLSLFLLLVLNSLRTMRAGINVVGAEARPLLFGIIFGFLSLLMTLVFNQLVTTWLYVWAIIGISLRIAVSTTEGETTRP